MAATKRVFISDVHIGVRGSKEWFQDKHKANLIDTLEEIAGKPDQIKDLVLLGDFFENWMAPVNKPPPTIDDIVKNQSNQDIFKALEKCTSSTINVYYLNGNHDMHINQKDLNKLPIKGKIQFITHYHAGLLYGEHGSRFAMFNARDKMHDPFDGLPIGYFVTRILASSGIPYDSPGAIKTYIDDLLEAAFTTQTLAESLIEALMELAKLKPDTKIRMHKPRRTLEIREVQQRYRNLFDRWVHKFGFEYAINAVRADAGTLGWFGDRLCKKKGYKVVVLGHTHHAEVDKDRLLTPDRGYANAGHWCTDKPTYVEVDKLPDKYKIVLKTLKRNKNGKLKADKKDIDVPL